ncbi:uncharacterized protein LOC119102062, partial [Pollicipes pollicipes]|uniref:uncharacterized protein LOC119102062 n=1 Tax=Pollicipes pollicipes TaxID=41117 RepID=UPI0018858B47
MEATPAFGVSDAWLPKKDALEHQYCLKEGELESTTVDEMGLLPSGDAPTADEPAADGADTGVTPFRVTMYQCAQCKNTFSTLDQCVNHQCLGAAVDSSQPAAVTQEAVLDADTGHSNYRWAQHDTEALLEILTESVDKFTNPNIKRKFIWMQVCDQMTERGFNISQIQCENRWKTLKAMHRKSQATGSSPPFYREMCTLSADYPQLMTDGVCLGGDREPGAGGDRAGTANLNKTVWNREASLTMLALLKARHKEYSDPSIKRRFLWGEISEAMRNISMDYTPEQCEGRMKTLLQAYKRAQMRWELSGEEVESDCYYQVDELVRLIPELAAGAAGRGGA